MNFTFLLMNEGKTKKKIGMGGGFCFGGQVGLFLA